MPDKYKLFYISTGIWTLIPDLGIEVHQHTGHTIGLRVYPDGIYTTASPILLGMRLLSNGP